MGQIQPTVYLTFYIVYDVLSLFCVFFVENEHMLSLISRL